MNFIRNGLPNLFGDGLVGFAMTGCTRIPVFMSSCASAMMVGELTIRGFTVFLTQVGFKPEESSWMDRAGKHINESGLRPYRTLSVKELAVKAVALAVLGIVGSEFVNLLSGYPPNLYNHVLTFVGPLRVDTSSYITNVIELLRNMGVLT